jgi:hypothetical protein
MGEEDRWNAVRRGAEHVRITGTTEEIGEIVPAPVETDDRSVEVRRDRDDEEDLE